MKPLATNDMPPSRQVRDVMGEQIGKIYLQVTILNKFLKGCHDNQINKDEIQGLRYLSEGLLKQAQALYKKMQRQDIGGPGGSYKTLRGAVFSEFLTTCCRRKPDAEVSASVLYRVYQQWHNEHAEGKPLSQKAFGGLMIREGFEREKRGTIRYHGVSVISSDSI